MSRKTSDSQAVRCPVFQCRENVTSTPIKKDGKVKYEPAGFSEASRDDLVLFVKGS